MKPLLLVRNVSFQSFSIKSIMAVVLLFSSYLCFCRSAIAQELDGNCVINIANRTVQVDFNGLWQMPNIPSFMGYESNLLDKFKIESDNIVARN